MQPDEWMVGVALRDGSYDVFTHDSRITPSRITEIIFPMSLPWRNEPVLFPAVLRKVAIDDSRDAGPEKRYRAFREDTVPNTDQLWTVELELWEYPPNVFNTAQLEHTEQVRNSHWEREDLLDAIRHSD